MPSNRLKMSAKSLVAYSSGFVLALGCLLLALGLYPWVLANYTKIEAASDNNIALRRLFSLIQDAETGQRGFLLTGSESYLTPYKTASENIQTEFDGLLKRLEDPSQRERVSKLRQLFQEKSEELEASIEARRTGGLPAALEIVNSGAEVDLIVSDVVMPRLGGLELYARLKERGNPPPLLLASGYGASGVDPEMLSEKGVAIVRKPYSPDELLRKIRGLLDN